MVRYVTIEKFSELTGYTPQAVYDKRRNGVWLDGSVVIKAPDGRLLVDLEGYEQWVETALAGDGRPKRRMKSPSPIVGNVAANVSISSPPPLTTRR
jgi:hypothetical protein